MFDDLEPIVLRVHDLSYLSRLAIETENMRRVQPDDDAAPASLPPLCRNVSVSMSGDTFASARS